MRPPGDFGAWGEEIARQYFVGKGYALVAENWRMGHYEVDLVVRQAEFVVFVEVKTRKAGSTDPIEAVNKRKRAHMIASADAFLKYYDLPFEYRFDILGITGDKEHYTIEHIPNAFYPSLKRINFSFRL